MIRANAVVGALAAAALLCAGAAHAQTTAFTGATVWDGTGAPPVPDATILVRDGRIVSVGRGAPPGDATVVDLSGRWVIPGLVNAHGHVSGLWTEEGTSDAHARLADDLHLYARYGVTTVNSLGGEPVAEARALREAERGGDLGRARLLFAGEVVTDTAPSAAAATVARNAHAGVDWIKIRVDDNLGTTAKMPWPAVQAVMEAAGEHHLRVATHLFYLEDAKRLLRMGSGLIAHSVRDRDVDAELIGLLRDTGVCYVPTLTREVSTFAYAERPAFFDDPFFLRWAHAGETARVSDPASMRRVATSPASAAYRVALGQAERNLEVLASAGIPIAMGTDSGPAGRFPGYFEHLELALMAGAGMSPEQVLRSATGVAADCLALRDVGTLEPGRWADFVVLADDPLADIAATKSLVSVYVAGSEVR